MKPAELLTKCDLPLDRSGRVAVREDLRPEGFDNVFVLGDVAHLIDPRTKQPLPPLGQVAFQQGSHTAKNISQIRDGVEVGRRPIRP